MTAEALAEGIAALSERHRAALVRASPIQLCIYKDSECGGYHEAANAIAKELLEPPPRPVPSENCGREDQSGRNGPPRACRGCGGPCEPSVPTCQTSARRADDSTDDEMPELVVRERPPGPEAEESSSDESAEVGRERTRAANPSPYCASGSAERDPCESNAAARGENPARAAGHSARGAAPRERCRSRSVA